jgi:hypothetical protein
MTLTPFVLLEMTVGLATIALALYRKFLGMREENLIHLGPARKEKFLSKPTWRGASITSTDGAKR